ncbi:NAD(P)-binding protein [Solirubrobacter phytolaccae]|uniref:NAD(P)-binding protein n=1 Tax=Solirubrobacter phytolaccae TaxID=1404360 RepID=A0A9X3N2R0_9ACTN|nr:NAD(P)-binding protein [Solirubrobacter phytolaccae]MDA0178765.1 NAD(P)-binding protein [Solirubrobacter phytolaccae]
MGAGRTGLAAAQLLSEDPRHLITVFETGPRFGGRVEERAVADTVDQLFRLGVTLHTSAQVERLAADGTGVDLWINGLAERFDVALVATAPADVRGLLLRSGVRRSTVRSRVYFTADVKDAAREVLGRVAADHLDVWLRRPSDARITDVLRSLARRADGLVGSHVECLDLSRETWPPNGPAVYIANHRRALDAVVPRHVSATDVVATATIDDTRESRAAALAALTINVPIVPIGVRERPTATSWTRLGRPHAQVRVVIGEPFYPETSSIVELMDDMRVVVRHLEQLASRPPSRSPTGPTPITTGRITG